MFTVFVSVAIVETPSATALATVTVATVETIGGALRLRELVLGGGVELMRGWVWEIWADSGGAVVVNGSSGCITEEPGDVVGLLLHGVYLVEGRRGRVAPDKIIYTPPAAKLDVMPWNVLIPHSITARASDGPSLPRLDSLINSDKVYISRHSFRFHLARSMDSGLGRSSPIASWHLFHQPR